MISTLTSVPMLPVEVAEEVMALCVAMETEASVVDVEEVMAVVRAIKFCAKFVSSQAFCLAVLQTFRRQLQW
jgi:hypothetical protein